MWLMYVNGSLELLFINYWKNHLNITFFLSINFLTSFCKIYKDRNPRLHESKYWGEMVRKYAKLSISKGAKYSFRIRK